MHSLLHHHYHHKRLIKTKVERNRSTHIVKCSTKPCIYSHHFWLKVFFLFFLSNKTFIRLILLYSVRPDRPISIYLFLRNKIHFTKQQLCIAFFASFICAKHPKVATYYMLTEKKINSKTSGCSNITKQFKIQRSIELVEKSKNWK